MPVKWFLAPEYIERFLLPEEKLFVLLLIAEGEPVGILLIALIHDTGSKYLTVFPVAVAYSISDLVLAPT